MNVCVQGAIGKPCIQTNVVNKPGRMGIVAGIVEYWKSYGSSPGSRHRVQNRGDELHAGSLSEDQ